MSNEKKPLEEYDQVIAMRHNKIFHAINNILGGANSSPWVAVDQNRHYFFRLRRVEVEGEKGLVFEEHNQFEKPNTFGLIVAHTFDSYILFENLKAKQCVLIQLKYG
ncbi:hypothetical protein HYW87_02660 [Candidatus Roizmanbacteria bacterium]|nr:hypothetical protein [Candidatus Roizmanbacteria bacterium]